MCHFSDVKNPKFPLHVDSKNNFPPYVLAMEMGNTILVTREVKTKQNIVYIWGCTDHLSSPEETCMLQTGSNTPNPIEIFRDSSNDWISVKCSGRGSCLLLCSNGTLFGFGRGTHNELTNSYFTLKGGSNWIFPLKIYENVRLFEITGESDNVGLTAGSFIITHDNKLMSVGELLHATILPNGEYTEIAGVPNIHNVKDIFVNHFVVYIIFTTPHAYGWGERLLLKFDNKDYFGYPTTADFWKTGSDLPSGVGISSISCSFRSTYWCLLVSNDHHLLSYGVNDEMFLGRKVLGEDWKLPKSINTTFLGKGEKIVMVNAAQTSSKILSNFGNLFTFGKNWDYGMAQFYESLNDSMLPQRVLTNVTYIPEKQFVPGNLYTPGFPDVGDVFGRHHFVIKSTFSCYGKESYSENACGGTWRGKCVLQDTCKCYVWRGDECDESYACNGVLKNYTYVCSSNGDCEYNTTHTFCECDDGYWGNDCQYHKCYGVDFNSPNVCNNRKGTCVSKNLCKNCEKHFHGTKCHEKIDVAKFSQKKTKISVEYVVDESLISSELKVPFNCSLIVYNFISLKLSNYTDSCKFVFHEITESSKLEISNSNEKLKFIYLRTTSNSSEIVSRKVKNEKNNLLYFYVFIPLIATVGLIFCCAFSIMFAIVLIIDIKRRKKMKKFEELENFDLLLEEQKAHRNTTDMAHLKIKTELFQIKYDELNVLKKIGAGGGSAVVYECLWKGSNCAFKCFKTTDFTSNQNSFEEFEKETELLDPSILVMYGAVLVPPRVGYLCELCERGDLEKFLGNYREDKQKMFSLNGKMKIFMQTINGMIYLHSNKCIHRDLKSANIGIKENFDAKIMDFGMSKFVTNATLSLRTGRLGTSYYMSPEIFRDEKYDETCDCFSWAMIVYECIFEKFNGGIFDVKNPHRLEAKIATDPNFRQHQWLRKLLKNLWDDDYKSRMQFSDIKKVFEREWDFIGKNEEDVMTENEKLKAEIERLKKLNEEKDMKLRTKV